MEIFREKSLFESTNWQQKQIDPVHALRPVAPAEVWDHRAYPSWRNVIWTLIEDFADAEVQAAFKQSPPAYVVGDDLSWLDTVVCDVRKFKVDSKVLLAERLRERYRAFRAVHGTRTAQLDLFYREGLKPLDPVQFHAQARDFFLNGAFPELSDDSLRRAISAVDSNGRGGRVYFEANEEMLISRAGHYMLYGSEYLVAIAAQLEGPRDYRQVLKQHGKPTIFICDVPIEFLRESALLDFAGQALASVFQELLDGSDFLINRWRGAGFYITQTLLPCHIVGHYHPTIQNDPIGNWR